MSSCAAAASATRDASVRGASMRPAGTSTSTLLSAIVGMPLEIVRRLLQFRVEVVAQADERFELRPAPVEQVAALRSRQLAFDGDVVEVDDRLLPDDHLVRFLDHLRALALFRRGRERQDGDHEDLAQHLTSSNATGTICTARPAANRALTCRAPGGKAPEGGAALALGGGRA